MTFDFNLNSIVEIGVIVAGWIITIVKIDGRLKSVERDIREVVSLSKWRERMGEQMLQLRRDVDDLRRGRGFIQGAIAGEYTYGGKRNPDTENGVP